MVRRLKTIKQKKERIFQIIQIGSREDFISRLCDAILVTAILLNISVLFLSTFQELSGFRLFFDLIEGLTVFIFCLEYIARIWTAEFLYPEWSKKRQGLGFFFLLKVL